MTMFCSLCREPPKFVVMPLDLGWYIVQQAIYRWDGRTDRQTDRSIALHAPPTVGQEE